MPLKSKPILVLAALAGLLVVPAGAAAPSYGFTVNISLTPKAAALLKAKKELIVVEAMYQGEPIPSKSDMADFKGGTVDLGREAVTMPGATGHVAITGTKVILAHLAWVKEARVLVMAFTARKGAANNLINCTMLESAVQQVRGKTLAIACKLIGE